MEVVTLGTNCSQVVSILYNWDLLGHALSAEKKKKKKEDGVDYGYVGISKNQNFLSELENHSYRSSDDNEVERRAPGHRSWRCAPPIPGTCLSLPLKAERLKQPWKLTFSNLLKGGNRPTFKSLPSTFLSVLRLFSRRPRPLGAVT